MFKKLSRQISMITLSLSATIIPSFVSANEIKLTFEQSGMTIDGIYSGFHKNAYVIETTDGLLYVPAILVSCEGLNCLDILLPTTQGS